MPHTHIRTPRLSVGASPLGGRGVFAERPYAPGEVIELAPVLLVPRSQRPLLAQTMLSDYAFQWEDDPNSVMAIGLGFASLYNHSYHPNAKYIKKIDAHLIQFEALQSIQPSEEILVNYHGNPADKTPVWFEVITQ
jgi:hypothetical protein